MAELLKLKSDDWELTIWSKDISSRQFMYVKTLNRYSIPPPPLEIIFSDEINCELTQHTLDSTPFIIPFIRSKTLHFNEPIFFENTQYQFEFIFTNSSLKNAYIDHKLIKVRDSFNFVESKYGFDFPRLFGIISTGNDIGWLKLPLHYSSPNGSKRHISISFEVLPLKMNMHNDLISIYKTLDKQYPLLRFSLANKTEQYVSKGQKLGYFPLLWLAHFETLRSKMISSLQLVSQSPHRILMSKEVFLKVNRIKGKLANKQLEKIHEDLHIGLIEKRYPHLLKHLTFDTPENRFIKMVINTTKSRLVDFHKKLVDSNRVPESQRLTNSFIQQVESWQKPFTRFQKKLFLGNVGAFEGLIGESLVLQKKTGYHSVYKIWQDLKFYLDMFANQSKVSLKSIEEIYEVWCFLELRRIVVDILGFEEKSNIKANLTISDMEYKLKDGFRGAFHFKRSDGLNIRLSHEPIFKGNSPHIRTYWVTQKPDILMELIFPDHKKCLWIFDAKYRISPDNDLSDYVPEDALNQMHRYRDALIQIEYKLNNQILKSRPVFSAFALYPGFFDQSLESNPYTDLISETGIGAFALLPSSGKYRGNKWLENYLIENIGLLDKSENSKITSERLFVKEPSRIPFTGMRQKLYSDLVLILPPHHIDPKILWGKYHLSRDNFIISRFLLSQKYSEHMLHEVAFIGLIDVSDQFKNHNGKIKELRHVKNIFLKKSRDLFRNENESNSSDLFWVFELGARLELIDPIENIPIKSFPHNIKLTTLDLIHKVKDYSILAEVYQTTSYNGGITI